MLARAPACASARARAGDDVARAIGRGGPSSRLSTKMKSIVEAKLSKKKVILLKIFKHL